MSAPTQDSRRTGLGLTLLQLLRFVLFNLLTPAALFLAAGTLAWPQAWVYVLASFGFTFFGLWLVRRSHPDLLQERAEAIEKQNIPVWDKRLMPVLALVQLLLTALTVGLDKRFGWSPPLPL
jgi:cytosine/uracil/thiamine/allantoin permease